MSIFYKGIFESIDEIKTWMKEEGYEYIGPVTTYICDKRRDEWYKGTHYLFGKTFGNIIIYKLFIWIKGAEPGLSFYSDVEQFKEKTMCIRRFNTKRDEYIGVNARGDNDGDYTYFYYPF